MDGRLAVVLFNLGGPDSLEAVRPFLYNLFSDRAIIDAPNPIRRMLAGFISRRRAPVAREIYERLGGASPLLPLTRDQASALQVRLRAQHPQARVFVSMRYWHPLSEEAVAHVKAFQPKQIVLLPLYPQFSTTTTGSSFADWDRASQRVDLRVPTVRICCYPTDAGFVSAIVSRTRTALDQASLTTPYRLLFSAHGLPKRVIARGDPYQSQVEQTVTAVVAALGEASVDWVTCYQSRVGPLQWIGPSTEDELRRAAADRRAAVVVPIAFVSEHSETLVELDIEYRTLADKLGIPNYVRVLTVGTAPAFIDGLARLIDGCLDGRQDTVISGNSRACDATYQGCPRRRADGTHRE